jgi:2-dehydro-3-deoxyphosphogluconate aldolase/(4S)-4-hydroxy-2-oxoglutarate aldolase
MSRSFDWNRFHQCPIVGILRGFDLSAIEPMAQAAAAGGIVNLEVTFNTRGAAQQIKLLQTRLGEQINIGAGTICTLDDLNHAQEAGATFIVTPIVAADVIQEAVARKLPVFAGAMTPTEIHLAWSLGATIVKVFPSDQLGPAYIRNVKAPLSQIPLMPTGGVTPENLPEYKRAGAAAYGVGSPLFAKSRVLAGDWPWITQQASRFVEAFNTID